MKNYIIFAFMLFFLLQSCHINKLFSPVKQVRDEYKKQNISFYESDKIAKQLENNRFYRHIHFEFRHIVSFEKVQDLIKMNCFVALDNELDNTFYINAGDSIYTIHFSKIDYFLKHHKYSNSETKITKEETDEKNKEKTSKEIITITNSVNEYDNYLVKATAELPAVLIDKLTNSEKIRLRFYISDKAYTVKFNKKQTQKIAKVYKPAMQKEMTEK